MTRVKVMVRTSVRARFRVRVSLGVGVRLSLGLGIILWLWLILVLWLGLTLPKTISLNHNLPNKIVINDHLWILKSHFEFGARVLEGSERQFVLVPFLVIFPIIFFSHALNPFNILNNPAISLQVCPCPTHMALHQRFTIILPTV